MKKLLLAALVLFGLSGVVRAEDAPKIWLDLGQVKLFVPLTSLDAVYQWDFVGKRSLVGGETPVGSIWKLAVTAGGVTSLEGRGAPFLGAHLMLSNPVESWVPLSAVHPGLFAGRDFNSNAWIFGVKATVNIFG